MAVTKPNSNPTPCRIAAAFWLGAAVVAATIDFAAAQTAAPASTVPAAQPPAAAPPGPADAGLPAAPPAPPSAGLALPPQPPPVWPAPPTEKRGFLNGFGDWWNKSTADFNAKMKDQQSKLDEFNKQSTETTAEAVKEAAEAVVRWPTSRIIEIHEVCATAGNGAPDCGPAVANACRAKGFRTGQPVDIRSAEKCAASLWMSGQAPSSDCPVETVVLRAACQ